VTLTIVTQKEIMLRKKVRIAIYKLKFVRYKLYIYIYIVRILRKKGQNCKTSNTFLTIFYLIILFRSVSKYLGMPNQSQEKLKINHMHVKIAYHMHVKTTTE